MIQVFVDEHNVIVSGHAITGAPPGQNIVCAAVSAITLTLIEGLESITEDTIEALAEPGDVRISWEQLRPGGRVLIDTWFLGITRIREEYGHIEIL